MDELDRAILRVVQSEGRVPLSELADRIGLSHAPTFRRLRKLETDGIIEGYAAKLSTSHLGLNVTAFVNVRFSSHDLTLADRFDQFVRQEPSVLRCDNVTGESDYLMIVLTRDLTEYEAFTRRLRAVEGITAIHSQISLRTVKDSRSIAI